MRKQHHETNSNVVIQLYIRFLEMSILGDSDSKSANKASHG